MCAALVLHTNHALEGQLDAAQKRAVHMQQQAVAQAAHRDAATATKVARAVSVASEVAAARHLAAVEVRAAPPTHSSPTNHGGGLFCPVRLT